jgi:predicted ester cyclase
MQRNMTASGRELGVIERGWNEGDLGAIDELVHPDYVRHTAQGDIDRDGFKQRIAMVRNAFPDLHVTIDDVVEDGDRRALRSTVRGTHQNAFLGIEPTGAPVEFQSWVFVHLKDGLLLEEWEFVDTPGLLAQLRAGGAPTAG